MSASELELNNTALRTYINIGIIQADIENETVTTTDIVRGEYVGVTPDHQFTSGDLYTQFCDLLEINEKYYTAHIKPFDLLDTTAGLFPIQGSGKRVILERPADVIYSVGLLAVSKPNPQLEPNRRSSFVYCTHTEGDVIHPGDELSSSLGRIFTEDDDAYAPIDSDGSGNVGILGDNQGFYCRRWYSQRVGFTDLPAGIHHFYIVVNARCDRGSIKTLSSQIEVFHKTLT